MLKERLREIIEDVVIENYLEGLESIVKELVSKFRPLSVIIAGSLAERRFVLGLSDIDILVITSESPNDRFMLRAIGNTDVEISFFSYDEVIHAIRRGNQFIKNAIINGKEVYGDIKHRILKIISNK
ncbi:MAG: hypothetical protein DRO18_00035 [Thermoprotei archaeon]|nr:MAG: hypothetical protein DRO18_00035 [Thermoprotei archaeon]